MIQFDEHMFQMGWFNHQLENLFNGWRDRVISKHFWNPCFGVMKDGRLDRPREASNGGLVITYIRKKKSIFQ